MKFFGNTEEIIAKNCDFEIFKLKKSQMLKLKYFFKMNYI